MPSITHLPIGGVVMLVSRRLIDPAIRRW